MAYTLQEIRGLSGQTLESLPSTKENWTGFLHSVARHYKYSFHDQLLIYAQRPDATACAPYETWNTLGRYVRRGSKGIALINERGNNPSLSYVFDVSDTGSRDKTPLGLWEAREEYAPKIIEELENHFGDIGAYRDMPFPLQLFGAVSNVISNHIEDYFSELETARAGSALEGMDSESVRGKLHAALIYNVHYIVMLRLGLDPDRHYAETDAFSPISVFNTCEVVKILGAATSDMSKTVLRQIERTIRTVDDEKKVEHDKYSTYNMKQEHERGAAHGEENRDNVHREGRFPLSRPDFNPTAGRGHREVREDAPDVPDGAPARNVQRNDIVGGTVSSSVGGQTSSQREDRSVGEGNGGVRGRDGSAEGERPDGMGAADEQHQSPGGRNSAGRTDLRIEEQGAAENAAPFLLREILVSSSITPDEVDAILRDGGNDKNSVLRITSYFAKGKTLEENTDYLRREYLGGRYKHTLLDGGKGYQFGAKPTSVWFDGTGMTIGRGKSALNAYDYAHITWEQAAAYITALMEQGLYVSPDVLKEAGDNEKRELADDLWNFYRDDIGHMPDEWKSKKGYPGDVAIIKILLDDPTERQAILDRLEKDIAAWSKDPNRRRWHNPKQLLVDMRDSMISPKIFPLAEIKSLNYMRFITEDQIDAHLTRGSVISEGKFRILSHFLNDTSPKGRANFLKGECGHGGGTWAGVDDGWINAEPGKGISLKLGRLSNPYCEVTLSWSEAATRIGELIQDGRYMTRAELDKIPGYENIILARQINNFYHELPDYSSPFNKSLDFYYPHETELEALNSFLNDTESIDTVLMEMRDVVENMSEDERYYRLRKKGFESLSAYREGTYSLFPGLDRLPDPELVKTLDRHTILPFTSSEATAQLSFFGLENDDVVPDGQIHDYEQEQLVQTAVEEQAPLAIETQEQSVPVLMEQNTTSAAAPAPNFHITDDNLGAGGTKAKYRYNIDAMITLLGIEAENRSATPEEQETLSRYVGWGGIPQAFDENNPSWSKEYAELKELLSDKEYDAARSSTLNAHYTSPTVIKAMYEALERIGFKSGNVLEPAMGVGNFFGLLPDEMKGSKLYGVELDSITGRIAKQLYPEANIAVKGYEEMDYPDSFFDLAIGNVPFGGYGVADKRYDKHKLLIHDYFFAKTLDKVRPGGIIAFLTSKGTLDKQNPEVRKYIAQRAELLGAVRLPNNAFLANAGTEVTSDILFLQKRDRPIDIEPDWVHLGQLIMDNGELIIPVNSYFVEHPQMVLGKMTNESGTRMYGNSNTTTCVPIEGADLGEQLRAALSNIHTELPVYEREESMEEGELDTLPADPSVRNYSFAVVGDRVYFRENSVMKPVETSITAMNRIRGMIELRDCVRSLIDMQMEGFANEAIEKLQHKLHRLYDSFTQKYGQINSRGNALAFSDDSAYYLLCSLEVLDNEGKFLRKADMFSKRTIRPLTKITSVDTPSEALAVSLSEKACVDLAYMSELTGMDEKTLFEELRGVIYLDFQAIGLTDSYVYRTADDFLSGNVREKLKKYKHFLEVLPKNDALYEAVSNNVAALEASQPKDLTAGEIDVRLGATWIPTDVIKDFIVELLEPDLYASRSLDVHYSSITGEWRIDKPFDGMNVKANKTFGTGRINAYHIIDNTLNLRDVRIFDTKIEDGRERRVLNGKETVLAQQKQQAIIEAFTNWIWQDPERRERLTALYNESFNSIRPREYDGSHIKFVGMNPEISLRPHQQNAVARVLYGGNSLLAHVVGAGKTYEMAAAAMESKRLGLCNKSMIVVPNHIVGQFAGEFLQLYPSANILVATKKDFETANRKKFCARIATGDYDAVLIGHSQFERIPMSLERQRSFLENEINDLMEAIAEAKEEKAERFTVKQMERARKGLEIKLQKLNNAEKKDNVIDFEELGVDRLFIDEADNYKNLFLQTKMRNVAGIAQTEAQKSSDLYMKCRYMDELTGSRGVVFATGTPISNSMTELFTMQKYLQYDALQRSGLHHFDSWASTFGERVTSIEIAPEGTGYRAKTRFAKFFNLPELLSMFKEVADIQTKDMLDLPVPEVRYHNVALKPSEFQKDMVKGLAERAEAVRAGNIDPHLDNMLRITNDGRKLALDQRMLNPMLPDDPNSKVSACANNVYGIWERTKADRLTQLVFSDLSTPKNDGSYNVYDDIRDKLIERGVPREEIAYIHEADTDAKKIKLFSEVRSGKVRVLIGSTAKMGAGTNVQTRLCALHHLDVPWRPRDIEQREGRIARQGNENKSVDIFRYVTESTFDSYMWQTIEHKQHFISQIMTSKASARSCEDVDATALSYAEVKALAAGDPDIKERMTLENDVKRLKTLKSGYLSNKYELESAVMRRYPELIAEIKGYIERLSKDVSLRDKNNSDDFPGMTLYGSHFADKAEAGTALLEACKAQTDPERHEIGAYRGFALLMEFSPTDRKFNLILHGACSHVVELGSDIHGNIQRVDNMLNSLPKRLVDNRARLYELERQKENATDEAKKPFEYEFELAQKLSRLAELDAKLKIGRQENDASQLEDVAEEMVSELKKDVMVR